MIQHIYEHISLIDLFLVLDLARLYYHPVMPENVFHVHKMVGSKKVAEKPKYLVITRFVFTLCTTILLDNQTFANYQT